MMARWKEAVLAWVIRVTFPVAEVCRNYIFIVRHDAAASKYTGVAVAVLVVIALLFGVHGIQLLRAFIPSLNLGSVYLFGQLGGYFVIFLLVMQAWKRSKVEVHRVYEAQSYIVITFEHLRHWWGELDRFTQVDDSDFSRDIFVSMKNVKLQSRGELNPNGNGLLINGGDWIDPPYSQKILAEYADTVKKHQAPFRPQSLVPAGYITSHRLHEEVDAWEIEEIFSREVASKLGLAIGSFTTALMVLGFIMFVMIMDTVQKGAF